MGRVDRAATIINTAVPWITSRRWYGDKSRNHVAVTLETLTPVADGDHAAALAIVRFAYERGPDSRYFIPILVHQAEGDVAPQDALEDPGFLQWCMSGFVGERVVDGWRWSRTAGPVPDPAQVTPEAVRVISAEQSNTSIVVGERWIAKVFRKLQPGINPDLEIGAFLSQDNRFTHVPSLHGLVERDSDGEVITIAALQQFVPNEGDGWSWVLSQLETQDMAGIDDLVAAIGLLGRRTAELHLALASDSENAAFAPERFTHQDADALIRRVIAEMEESVEELAKRLSQAEVERIHKGLGQVMSGAWPLVGSWKTRVHGDYHLGQTLRTPDGDFVLIDFEGEPSRPIEQRREKQTPLKDVAGMLRSLDYAAATAMASAGEDRRVIIGAWLREATDAFQTAYRKTILEGEVDLVPRDPGAFRAGLDLMIAEKALYEIRYELNNRPDWLAIPLNGVRRLVGIPADDAGAMKQD